MATKPFEVHGPFPVMTIKNHGGGRRLNIKPFFGETAPAGYLAGESGCYVFAIRNRGLTPVYIGMATKSFKQEVFNVSNIPKFTHGLNDYKTGVPVMYFVVHPTQPGKINETEIELIEQFLINAGAAKNPKLQNIKGKQAPKWRIKGVVRGGKGKPSRAASEFAKLFDIERS